MTTESLQLPEAARLSLDDWEARRPSQTLADFFRPSHPVAASSGQRKNLVDGYFLARAQQNAEKKD